MRKGYSFLEILIIIAVIPILLIVINSFIVTMFNDVPKTEKAIYDNSVMLFLLNQMQRDIDAAKNLPQSINGNISDANLFLIEQADKVIHYQIKDKYVYRYGFKGNQQIPEDTRDWLLPDTKINWQVRRQNGRGYAVEIQHYSKYKHRGDFIKKMENSHIFYVGILE
ncbi:MAG: hypothetical protein JW715_10375 [Sedimentisphaerales bacterium]|nr:hypothetical protein [Sedimentisphaerales bacterium]